MASRASSQPAANRRSLPVAEAAERAAGDTAGGVRSPGAGADAVDAPEDDPLDWPRGGLSSGGRRVARAAAEALLADYDEEGRLVPASGAACDRAVGWLDRSLGRGSPDLRRGFRVIGLLLEMLPIAVIGVPRRMTRLSLEQRVAYLGALERSDNGLFTMMLTAFKIPMSIPAFEEGPELESTGFDRPSTVARRAKRAAGAGRGGEAP